MTYEEFEKKVKKKTGFDKYWYYGLCIVVISLGLVLFFFILTRPEKFKGNHIFHYFGFSFLLLLGSYGLYKLPNRYNIVTIDSLQPLTRKKTAIENLLSQMGAVTVINDNYCSFTYRKSFWSSPYDIHLFFDDKRVCFSVQGQDYSDGGFIDFGGTEKFRRRLADDIQTFLL